MSDDPKMTPWAELHPDEKLKLQRAYQTELDRQPLTCSMDEKMNRFTAWLKEHGVSFTLDDLKRR